MVSSFNKDRVKKLQDLLTTQHSDALLISSLPNIIYLTNFAGFSKEEREGFLLITKNNNFILTDGRLITAVKDIPLFEPLEITAKSPLSFHIQQVIDKRKKLAIEENNITVLEYKMLQKTGVTITSIDLSSFRIQKTEEEIAYIEKACHLGDQAFDSLLPYVTKGISEKKLAFLFERFVKERDASLSFRPIVAFGKNAAIPHHLTSTETLRDNMFVLFDIGVAVDNYCSDMSRTIFFGKASTKEQRMYETVLQSQEKAITYIKDAYKKNGQVNAHAVDAVAREYIQQQGYPSIPHSLGHGIGIEVHEAPRLSPLAKDRLEKGMVFSVEPGIYLPNETGIRIEDLVALESSPRLLTHAPKTLIEIS